MSKHLPSLPRITEPDENLVHYGPSPLADAVTLCGLTDFIGHRQKGKSTRAKVTCNLCRDIVRYVGAHSDALALQSPPAKVER